MPFNIPQWFFNAGLIFHWVCGAVHRGCLRRMERYHLGAWLIFMSESTFLVYITIYLLNHIFKSKKYLQIYLIVLLKEYFHNLFLWNLFNSTSSYFSSFSPLLPSSKANIPPKTKKIIPNMALGIFHTEKHHTTLSLAKKIRLMVSLMALSEIGTIWTDMKIMWMETRTGEKE